MHIEPDFQDCGIVLVGNFNPAIISPHWLARYKLVGDRAADDAVIDVIHPSLTQFRVADLEVNVEPQRFQVLSRSGPWVRISDMVTSIFAVHLPHTPVTAFGINRSAHFRVGGEEHRNAIGRMLAPLEPWGEWGKSVNRGVGEERGGMISLQMQAVEFENKLRQKTTTVVQPSVIVPNAAGIYVGVNDHFEFSGETPETADIMKLLYDKFDSSIENSEKIINIVMSLKDKVDA